MNSAWKWLIGVTIILAIAAAWLSYRSISVTEVISEVETGTDELIPIVSQEDEETLEGTLICPDTGGDDCLLGFQTQTGEIYYISGGDEVMDGLYTIYTGGSFPLIKFTGMKTLLEDFQEDNYFFVTGYTEAN